MSFFAQTTIELTQASDVTTSTSSSGGAAGIGIGMIILYLALLVFFWVCLAKIYIKAGRKWWEPIIPIYSIYVLLKIIGRPGWWLILYFIPFVNIVVGIINLVDLAKAFGKGLGTALGLIFLPIIMYPIMAFGSSYQYKGTNSGGDQPDSSGPSPVPGPTPGATVPKEDNNGAAAGMAAGGAAASSGLASDQDTIAPPQTVSDSSDQQTGVDIGLDSSQDSSETIAQTDGAPSYPGEESSPDLSDDTAETTASTPDSESYQSGSTEEPQLSPDDSSAQSEPKPEDDSSSPDSNSSQDDQSAGGAAGPTFG